MSMLFCSNLSRSPRNRDPGSQGSRGVSGGGGVGAGAAVGELGGGGHSAADSLTVAALARRSLD